MPEIEFTDGFSRFLLKADAELLEALGIQQHATHFHLDLNNPRTLQWMDIHKQFEVDLPMSPQPQTEDHMSSTSRRVENIQKQLDALQSELKSLMNRPVEPPMGSIIKFTKTFGGSKTYTYAAIRSDNGWWTTGNRSSTCHSWDDLLDFVIESEGSGANWDRMSYNTASDGRKVTLLAKSGARLSHPPIGSTVL